MFSPFLVDPNVSDFKNQSEDFKNDFQEINTSFLKTWQKKGIFLNTSKSLKDNFFIKNILNNKEIEEEVKKKWRIILKNYQTGGSLRVFDLPLNDIKKIFSENFIKEVNKLYAINFSKIVLLSELIDLLYIKDKKIKIENTEFKKFQYFNNCKLLNNDDYITGKKGNSIQEFYNDNFCLITLISNKFTIIDPYIISDFQTKTKHKSLKNNNNIFSGLEFLLSNFDKTSKITSVEICTEIRFDNIDLVIKKDKNTGKVLKNDKTRDQLIDYNLKNLYQTIKKIYRLEKIKLTIFKENTLKKLSHQRISAFDSHTFIDINLTSFGTNINGDKNFNNDEKYDIRSKKDFSDIYNRELKNHPNEIMQIVYQRADNKWSTPKIFDNR